VSQIDQGLMFVYATKTDFNSIRDKKPPIAHLEPLRSRPKITDAYTTFNQNYPITISFYQQDRLDGAENETLAILDQMDVYAQQFIRLMNMINFDEDVRVAVTTINCTMSNIAINAMIKDTVDFLTGWKVTFDLEVMDDFNYCSLYTSDTLANQDNMTENVTPYVG
jgi:hypothetical protein